MVEWLERSDADEADEADETTSLWGFYKAVYTLKDLEKWLEQKQFRSDRKGKKKATIQPHTQKGKKNDGGDDSSSPPSKRIHKKSVGGCKQ